MEFTKKQTSIAKGVAICLMFVHHLFNYQDFGYRFLPGNSYTPLIYFFNLEAYLAHFGNICISIFLFLSGYGLFLGWVRSQQSPIRYSVDKIKDFYLTYWIYFIIFVPIGLLFFQRETLWNSTKLRYSGDPITFLLNFLGWSSTYNQEWWFVRIFVLTLLFLCPVYLKLTEKNTVWIAVISLFLFALSFKIDPFPSILNFTIWQTSFALGIICAKLNFFSSHSIRYLDKLGWIWVSSGLLLCLLIGLNLRARVGIKFDFLIAPIFIYFSVRTVEMLQLNKFFAYLGQYSFPLWLVHSFFCYYYFQDFIYFPKWSPLIFLLLLIVSLLSILGIEQLRKLIKDNIKLIFSKLA
ncbi:acyltransferase family protein [Nostoc sp. LEGE 12450]|uniref:acyltransferase family protein n=1 Tax=Nostoc sp. LEGE 12450 TaxID=1828643 RepID=UPI0018802C70|nr:acyltransferase family protein [Nostoc sp. LEGE 12450]MBE8990796.1 acyltransferase family protein [Nostoc sp. LEGE 12450]